MKHIVFSHQSSPPVLRSVMPEISPKFNGCLTDKAGSPTRQADHAATNPQSCFKSVEARVLALQHEIHSSRI